MKISNNTKATIGGILVASATAWATIDWTTFNIHTDFPKLILPVIIAIGGLLTSVNNKKDGIKGN